MVDKALHPVVPVVLLTTQFACVLGHSTGQRFILLKKYKLNSYLDSNSAVCVVWNIYLSMQYPYSNQRRKKRSCLLLAKMWFEWPVSNTWAFVNNDLVTYMHFYRGILCTSTCDVLDMLHPYLFYISFFISVFHPCKSKTFHLYAKICVNVITRQEGVLT